MGKSDDGARGYGETSIGARGSCEQTYGAHERFRIIVYTMVGRAWRFGRRKDRYILLSANYHAGSNTGYNLRTHTLARYSDTIFENTVAKNGCLK